MAIQKLSIQIVIITNIDKIMNQGLFFGQLVIGPAGSGKSTYCKHMQEMAETLKRNIIIVNLDPAAEHSDYRCDIDIKDLITLEDVMEEMQLGPNGALLFCMEYLLQSQEWINQQLGQVVHQDDYVIFDCPGQIQLFSDQNIFRELCKFLQNYGFSIISMYMMDVNFIGDDNKFASGVLQALAAQIALELPSITVLTKCDLVENKENLQKSLDYFQEIQEMDEEEQNGFNGSPLPKIIRKILHQNSLVSLRSLNLEDQDSIRDLLWQADNAIQYGQNLQPNDKAFEEAENYLNQQ